MQSPLGLNNVKLQYRVNVSNTAASSKRPDDLPDFNCPPLNEVTLGVQFAQPKGYQQIYAGEVWNLYRKDYPLVEEQAPLEPVFETFGLSAPSGQIKFVTGASHDRFWFLRSEGDELIQFQNDRLLHNWRKVGDRSNPYPRFEYMIAKYKNELEQLQTYMARLASDALAINQCEVSYINHIIVENDDELKASRWFRFISFGDTEVDDFKAGFREIVRDDAGKPQGRLIGEAVSGRNQSGQRVFVFTLTVRGAPKEPKIESALEFLSRGRELIVKRFAELTSEYAHAKWERCK